MIYLITGATGDVGAKIVDGLIRCGERPRVFVRDAQKARARFGERVEIYQGDLADATSLRAALEGVDSSFSSTAARRFRCETQPQRKRPRLRASSIWSN